MGKKDLFLPLITRGLPAGLHLDSLDHQHQIRPAYHRLAAIQLRRGEGAFLQAFVIQDKPARLPVQQLEQCAAAVQEHKNLPAGRVAAQLTADQPGQPVEALAHVADPAVQVVAVGGAQGEHYARWMSWLIRAGLAGQLTTTPLG